MRSIRSKPVTHLGIQDRGAIFADAQRYCVDFNGSDERMGSNELGLDWDIEDNWSCAVWFKPRAISFTKSCYLLYLLEAAGTENRIFVSIAGIIAGDPLQVEITNSAGAALKTYRYTDAKPIQDQWNFILCTWNGAVGDTLTLYHNGSEVAKDEPPVQDNAGAMTKTDRICRVGATSGSAYFDGLIHSIGLWDKVLIGAEQSTLWNGGDGNNVDWASNSGGYVSSSNLQHWFRIGHDAGDMGADSGVGSAVDIMNSVQNITAADDRVKDAP